jgi:hypothetical protein
MVTRECAKVGGQIHEVNHRRKESQERARGELSRLLRRRDEAVMKSWQIEAHCLHMEDNLRQHNITIPSSKEGDEEDQEDQEDEAETEQDNMIDPDDDDDDSNNKRLRIE